MVYFETLLISETTACNVRISGEAFVARSN